MAERGEMGKKNETVNDESHGVRCEVGFEFKGVQARCIMGATRE